MQVCLSADLPIERAARVASEAGLRCLDVSAAALEAYLATYPVALLDTTLSQHDLYIAVVSECGPIPVRAGSQGLLLEARFLDICTHLDALGGGVIAVARGTSGTVDQVVRALRALAELAAPFDIRIVLDCSDGEQPPREQVRAGMAIVERVKHSHVGLALDLDALADARQLDVERLGAVRVGGGTEPRSEAVALLAALGFGGPVSVRLSAGTLSIETVRRTAAALAVHPQNRAAG